MPPRALRQRGVGGPCLGRSGSVLWRLRVYLLRPEVSDGRALPSLATLLKR